MEAVLQAHPEKSRFYFVDPNFFGPRGRGWSPPGSGPAPRKRKIPQPVASEGGRIHTQMYPPAQVGGPHTHSPGSAAMTATADTRRGRTVDDAETAKFAAMAEEWWDPDGKFRPLHKSNPVRLEFVRDRICARFGRDPHTDKPLSGLTLADIGCGGGLLAEPLARLGAHARGRSGSAPR